MFDNSWKNDLNYYYNMFKNSIGVIMQLFDLSCKNIKLTVVDNEVYDENDDCFFEVIVTRSRLKDFLVNLLLRDNDSVDDQSLTRREKQVLKCLASGMNNSQIADIMHVSVHTAKQHIHNIFCKLSVQDRTEAVVKALKYRIIDI